VNLRIYHVILAKQLEEITAMDEAGTNLFDLLANVDDNDEPVMADPPCDIEDDTAILQLIDKDISWDIEE